MRLSCYRHDAGSLESESGELSAPPQGCRAPNSETDPAAPLDAGQPGVTALQPRHYLPYEPVVPVEVPAPELGEVGEVVLLVPLELPLLVPVELPLPMLDVPPEAPLELDLLK